MSRHPVQRESFDIAAEIAALTRRAQPISAPSSTFTGLCRDEGGRLAALELEHYPGMAEAEIAPRRRGGEGALAVAGPDGHPPLRHDRARRDASCSSSTASGHRGAAFAAAEFLMDYLKTRAPFWKREHLADGTQRRGSRRPPTTTRPPRAGGRSERARSGLTERLQRTTMRRVGARRRCRHAASSDGLCRCSRDWRRPRCTARAEDARTMPRPIWRRPVIPPTACAALRVACSRSARAHCLRTAAGARVALCGMVLNNTSWQVTERSCPEA